MIVDKHEILKWLRWYVVMDWPVFPCNAKTKAPLTPHGHHDATLDLPQIERWVEQFPGCAWATHTSAERGVIDIDPRNGGNESLAKLIAEHGEIPMTPKVKTGGGGWHYYCRFPPGTKSGVIAPGIDRKAEGGYVIIPPSRIDIPEHQGRSYAWKVKPWDEDQTDAPTWAYPPQQKAKAEPDDPWVWQDAPDDLLTNHGSPEGERRKTLCRLLVIHRKRGDSDSTIEHLAEAWANRCTPAFDEWRKHVAGSERWKVEIEDISDGELVRSLPVLVNKKQEPNASSSSSSVLSSLTLSQDAYHGLFGEMLTAITPETEADPIAVLLGWLACFGNIVGRGAWFDAGSAGIHHPVLYVGVVGKSSGSKGVGWIASRWPFREVEPAWTSTCIANGVGSGEGLIERIADEQTVLNSNGEVQVIPGAKDKRCLLRLSELSCCFKVGRRENATLSEHLREAWDGMPIHVPNRKKNGTALSSTEYTVSVVGDITPGVLRRMMGNGTEAFDGWANRFLWCYVQSDMDLPSGGNIGVLKPYVERLADTLTFAKDAGAMTRDEQAERLWESVYPSLKRSGDSVPHTDRARPYVVRLSMLYALTDKTTTIRVEHLRAAIAAWDYCRESNRLLFGGGPNPPDAPKPADPLYLRLLNAISKTPGINRTGLREVAGHKTPEPEIKKALAYLASNGFAHCRACKPEGAGRPAECWFPGSAPDGGGDGVRDDNTREETETTALRIAGASAEGGREITPSAVADADADSLGSKMGEGSNLALRSGGLVPSPEFPPRTCDDGSGISSLPELPSSLPAHQQEEQAEPPHRISSF
jgi:hypothetical protein